MSRGWQRSGMTVGEEVRIPATMFITGLSATERLISTKYVGDVDTGIMIDCKFKPAPITTNPESYGYRIMIPWASIWCGQVHVYREDDSEVVARRMPGRPLAYEVTKEK